MLIFDSSKPHLMKRKYAVVCGYKLNKSNCSLQTDNNGEVVKQITRDTRKLANVPDLI